MELIFPKLSLLFALCLTAVPCNHGKFQNVEVIDNILNSKDMKYIEALLTSEETVWNFNNLVPHRIWKVTKNCFGEFSPNSSPTHYWMTKLESSVFSRSPTWNRIKNEVALKIDATADFLHVHQAIGQISGRGDNSLVSNSCSGEESKHDFVVIVFAVVRNWNKNSYGELVIYGNDGEILRSIHPKNGRIVLFPCGYSYTIKPPSMDTKERLHTLTIHVSSSSGTLALSETKVNELDSSKLSIENYIRLHEVIRSFQVDKSEENSDAAQHVTRQFHTTKGHPIIVFDDIIPKNMIDFFADVMANGTYTNIPPGPDSSDNVPWILGFEVETIVESALWKYIKAIAKFASNKEGYYPYDVSCNNIRSHDFTKIHTDCEADQEEYTLLIYLNGNWTNNDLGETVFFNYEAEHGNEMVFAIRPKYGRVAIFHGTIPHSARPPSPLYHGARFTLAIKLASSKAEALKKTMGLLIEPLEQYMEIASPSEATELQKIIEDLRKGKITSREAAHIIEGYEKKLEEKTLKA